VLRTLPHYEVFNISGVVIAVLVAILTHMFQFHDRISDLLGIRRRFDVNNILIPLSQRVGVAITTEKEIQIRRHRDELIQAVFYRYASSRADNPLVDKHDIEHALNAWSWFWVCLEGAVYFGAGAIIAWWFASLDLCKIFAVVSVILIILAAVQRPRLGGYARAQIDTIANDATAAYEVKNRFNAL
jgi:hypothetical protein